MMKVKDFLLDNKNRIAMLAVVVVSIAVIFLLVAVLSERSSKGNEAGDDLKITTLAEENTIGIGDSSIDKEITTLADEETIGIEDATVDKEIGKIDDDVSAEEIKTKDALPYLIKVNRIQNCITIYKKNNKGEYTVPYKAIVCSTGKKLGDTPLGNFTTLISYEWLLMVDGSYGQYAYRYYGSILFHSVPYFSKNKDDLEYKQFNKLGEPASLGCVRVCVRDAIWLIENCPVGTPVVVYDDETSPGPLGKPEMIKIPVNSPYRGWDPTDPDPDNPWLQCKPEIEVNSTVNIAVNKYSMDTIVERIGATAKDTCGNDVTGRIKASGLVNFNKLGSYTLVLTVKDAIGKSDTKAVTINIEETEVTTPKPTTTRPRPTTTLPEITTPEETTTIPPMTTPAPTQPTTPKKRTVTLKVNSTSIRVLAGKYTKINDVVKAMGCSAVYSDGAVVGDASGFTAVSSGSYNLNKAGDYTLKLRYTDSKGISSQDVTVKVTVYTNPVTLLVNKPNIEVTAGEYQKESDIFSKMGITAVDSRGRTMSNVPSLVEYSGNIDINTPGTYELTLRITDSYNVASSGVRVRISVLEAETESETDTETGTDIE